ncbi:AcrR family transcriptional regulator [Crossiella equi]|uniref:AcrR family transcriptional regulator n=1 Tax=Crossiella equi TaxID=130796 RepID=A0ABS5AD10_9PSEU|nr:TetR/AcrR family transcriptional regulator [Crossiella equi]MBP2474152.1 AcrR family transcriptional regulator [Crossiella equi]
MTDAAKPARRRDSAATRALLLRAAAELFAERGFERTTVRDIAARAGVNQALLFRYCGSKEELFREVVTGGGEELADGPAAELPRRMVRQLLAKEPAAEARSLHALLMSAGYTEADRLLRHQVGERYVHALTGLTDGPDEELRAALVLAWMLGIGFARSVLQSEQLGQAQPEVIEEYVRRGVAALLERAE